MPDQHRIARYQTALEFAERQVAALVERYPDYFPIYTAHGNWRHAGELWTDWTGGFLVGMMWQFYRRTGSAAWRDRAEHYSRLLEHRKQDRNVHDLGFIFLNSYLPWYELTEEPAPARRGHRGGPYAGPAISKRANTSAASLAPESLFIDIMMNVPLYSTRPIETRRRGLGADRAGPLPDYPRSACARRRLHGPRRDLSTRQTGQFLRQSTHQGCERRQLLGPRAGLVAVRLQQGLRR